MNKNDRTEAAKHLLDGIGGVRADYVSDAEIQKDELIEKKEVRSGNRLTEGLIAAAAILIIGGIIWGILRSGKPDAASIFPEEYYRYWVSDDNKDVFSYPVNSAQTAHLMMSRSLPMMSIRMECKQERPPVYYMIRVIFHTLYSETVQ